MAFKKNKCIVLIMVWVIFICVHGNYYLKFYAKGLKNSVHEENYYIVDSVWDPVQSKWHDDTLLYTLFKAKTVYINPNSWYATYVKAFADHIVWDEGINSMMDMGTMEQDVYAQINHMLLLAHSTLFEENVWNVMVASKEGLFLFVEEESIYKSNSILFLHDELGNIYLKGVNNDK